jgi:hypothetical protein
VWADEVEEACSVAGRVILLRSVSGRPGAEGAPFEGRGATSGPASRVVVLLVALRWAGSGAMRRD